MQTEALKNDPEAAEDHPLKAIADELEHPSQSLQFLELFHKSAKKVEELSSSLKKVSVFIGVIGAFYLVCAVFSFWTTYMEKVSVEAQQAATKSIQESVAKGRLSSGSPLDELDYGMFFDKKSGELNV